MRVVAIVVGIIVAAAIAGGAWIGTRALLESGSAVRDPARIAAETVAAVKKQVSYPQRIDAITTLDDVTADGDTIVYHYTIAGADPSTVSKTALRDAVRSQLCAQKDGTKLLAEKVRVEYAYRIAEDGTRFSFVIAHGDC
jgi:hypothetical protein